MRRKFIAGLTLLVLPVTISAQEYYVEYFWDSDPGTGNGTVLGNSKVESFTLTKDVSVAGLSYGIHKLGLRALNRKDGKLNYSETQYRNFLIPTPNEKINRIEYYWDSDPGKGKANAFSISPDEAAISLSDVISTKSLTPGMHRLWIRACSDNIWSECFSRLVYVCPAVHKLQALEYYWDKDPGVGNGTKMEISTTNDSVKLVTDIPTYGMENGVHRLGMRALTDGTWSETQTMLVYVRDSYDEQISYLEYYWDKDPGKGKGKSITITPAGEISLDASLNIAQLSEGKHNLYLRAQSGSSTWSENYNAGTVEIVGDFSGDYSSEDYALEDAQKSYSNDGESGTYNSVTYNRSFADSNWQTLYVPISLSYNEWKDEFDVARLNDVHQYDDNNDGQVDRVELEAFIVESGSIDANTPYLIKAHNAGKKAIKALEDPTLYNAEENSFDCSSMNARFVFTGTYKTIDAATMAAGNNFTLTNNSLVLADSKNGALQPFRWYLTIERRGSTKVTQTKTVNVKVSHFSDDDDTPTAIHSVIGDKSSENNDNALKSDIIGYYTINGTRISTLKKGIIIVKFSDGTSRKIIVK